MKNWIFTSKADKSQIIIRDQKSAEEFTRLMASGLGQSWELKLTDDEESAAASVEAPAPQAPVAEEQPIAAVIQLAPAPAVPPTIALVAVTPEQAAALPPAPQEVEPATLPPPIVQEAAPVPVQPSQLERRAHPRYSVQMRVVIMAGGKTLITSTEDISQGGLRLLHPFVQNSGGDTFKVYICRPGSREKLEFAGRLIDGKRIAFASGAQSAGTDLQSWIDSAQPAKSSLIPKKKAA